MNTQGKGWLVVLVVLACLNLMMSLIQVMRHGSQDQQQGKYLPVVTKDGVSKFDTVTGKSSLPMPAGL